jgi:hypothetical protein
VPPEEANAHTADQHNRCEFGTTLLAEGECPRTGVVQVDGSLLCVAHAKLLRLQLRESTLLGTVFEMDKWLDNLNNRVDQLRWRRVLHQRDEVVQQLRFNRTLIEAHNVADQQG